ncbi:MAG: DUF1772 domain-containing protein [Croceibacterium sp.]
MITGLLALALGAAFCGAASYINIAEHPARMLLDDRAALAQWGPSYDRAFNYQAGLAAVSGLAGLAEGWLSGDWRWMIGAVLMLANWPYTLTVILPLNHRLKAIVPEDAGPRSRDMLTRWNHLHRNRSILSGLAVIAYLWAAVG